MQRKFDGEKSAMKKTKILIVGMLLLLCGTIAAWAGDSASASAGMTIKDLAKQLADTQVAVNIVWTLVAGFLVMFMQPGFALVETGLTRGKNVAHTMGMNFLVYAIGVLGFWVVGFAFQMGGVGALGTFGGDPTLSRELAITIGGKTFGLIGMKGFFLQGVQLYTPAVATLFLFQMVFMDTTCTIPTGALAERWKFTSFVLFSFVVATIIYPIYANWVWGGGWLSALGTNFGLGHGHVDFAGSSVVHMTGGVLALVLAKMLGPRLGKYGSDGRVNPIPAHNMVHVVTGTFILAFGWFGFNAGSTLAGMDTRLAVVATNTMLASAAGAFSAYLYVTKRFGKPDTTWLCNGMLAGLVAITAPCAFVSAWAAVFIGAVAGVLVVVAALFIEQKLKIDDPVGAAAVHGVNGAWGVLSLGLFANGVYGDGINGVAGGVRGLFYGDPSQFIAEAIGVLANIAWVAVVGAVAFIIIGKLVGNRVSAEDEIAGLDIPEMGVQGYSPDILTHQPSPNVANLSKSESALASRLTEARSS
jgi:Amt family ammonium transporter